MARAYDRQGLIPRGLELSIPWSPYVHDVFTFSGAY
jgi:hypothetical protein